MSLLDRPKHLVYPLSGSCIVENAPNDRLLADFTVNGVSPGDRSESEIFVIESELETFLVKTPGGRLHNRWDYEACTTPDAELACFAECLSTTGVYKSWIAIVRCATPPAVWGLSHPATPRGALMGW